MRTPVRTVLATVLAAMVLVVLAGPAQAAVPDERTGVDVSWPQCSAPVPAGFAFAVVGVNGGTASTTNGCLAEQLTWATTSTSGSAPGQPPVQLYVNTANPGEVLEEYAVQTWPSSNLDPRGVDSLSTTALADRNPYGACTTTPGGYRDLTNDLACSWQYGWNRAVESVDERLAPAARSAGLNASAADYTWWLDVETMNSWQQDGPDALARNTGSLEGMNQFYRSEGVGTVGIYSTRYQWRQIVGGTLSLPTPLSPAVGANLVGLPSWLAGASDAAAAQRWCTTAAGLTGGPVLMNQYIVDDLDHNHSCL